MTTEPKHRILVTVEGGVIQHIDNIPAGVTVEVRDYDRDDDRTHPSWSEEHQAFVGVWEGPLSAAPDRREPMRDALEAIARMKMDGEDGFDRTNDDAVDSFHDCIELARDALAADQATTMSEAA